MARRKQSRTQTPAVTRMWFHVNSGNATNFLDLSLAASVANRRFYRQSTQWAVAGMSLHTVADASTAPNGTIDVKKVPDTWMAHNAHTKAKSLWMKSQDQVLDEMPSIKAKYNDFKISLDADMALASVQPVSTSPASNGEIMLPVDSLNYPGLVGEWDYSQIVFPVDGGSSTPQSAKLHMVGDDAAQSLGIIHGYALSRSRPQKYDPNVPSDDGWMNSVFDVADLNEDIREDVVDQNDVPPYRVGDADGDDATQDREFYPGGKYNMKYPALHTKQFVTSTTVGGKTHIEGGLFGCGLIRFDWDIDEADESMYLCVDLVPGNYKGYLTEVY